MNAILSRVVLITLLAVSVMSQQAWGVDGSFDITNLDGLSNLTSATNTFSIGGTVNGLSGSGLVLQNNNGDDLAVDANGSFSFGTKLDDGSGYAVTIDTQPSEPDQICLATNSHGNLTGSDVTDIQVTCTLTTSCNANIVSGVTENSDATHEACETLVVGPDFSVEGNASIFLSSGLEIWFTPGLAIETGATLNADVCGQSLCKTSSNPMPYGCHSCVDQICDIDPSCCDSGFDEGCLDKVDTVCGLACEDLSFTITSLGASPSSITAGESATLSWTTENATSCTPSNGTGGWSSLEIDLPSGNTQIEFSTEGTYEFTLTCFGALGQDNSKVTVVVTAAAPTCDVTLTSKTVRTWDNLFGQYWPAPASLQLRIKIPDTGYYAIRFETGDVVDYGSLSTIEASGTSGARLGAVSKVAGCFDVAKECQYSWGRSGGILWDTSGTVGGCQLKPKTAYYWNVTFTNGVSPTSSTCLGTFCETYVRVVNPD